MNHELDLMRDESVIGQLALEHESAFRAVNKSSKKIGNLIGKHCSEPGFTGDDLAMRTMLSAGYHTREASEILAVSRRRRKELIGKRVDFLTANATSLNNALIAQPWHHCKLIC